jgi:hypothetical protein
MKIFASPAVKAILTTLASILAASPAIPALAPFALVLQPVAGLLVGWLHLPQPVRA